MPQSGMVVASWIWIPIVLAAAAAQTLRNASQRSLVKAAGTMPATFVRFGYGLPFAGIALVIVADPAAALPLTLRRFWWRLSSSQLAANALIANEHRSLSSPSRIRIPKCGADRRLFERVAWRAAGIGRDRHRWRRSASRAAGKVPKSRTGIANWLSPSSTLGLASGAAFALSAIGYRGSALVLGPIEPWVAGIYALVWAQSMQTVALGGYLWVKDRDGLRAVVREWRVSTLA
jgi:hypothetical protein